MKSEIGYQATHYFFSFSVEHSLDTKTLRLEDCFLLIDHLKRLAAEYDLRFNGYFRRPTPAEIYGDECFLDWPEPFMDLLEDVRAVFRVLSSDDQDAFEVCRYFRFTLERLDGEPMVCEEAEAFHSKMIDWVENHHLQMGGFFRELAPWEIGQDLDLL